eukprot:4023576-Pleurochrysis_carterae.AAC.5
MQGVRKSFVATLSRSVVQGHCEARANGERARDVRSHEAYRCREEGLVDARDMSVTRCVRAEEACTFATRAKALVSGLAAPRPKRARSRGLTLLCTQILVVAHAKAPSLRLLDRTSFCSTQCARHLHGQMKRKTSKMVHARSRSCEQGCLRTGDSVGVHPPRASSEMRAHVRVCERTPVRASQLERDSDRICVPNCPGIEAGLRMGARDQH